MSSTKLGIMRLGMTNEERERFGIVPTWRSVDPITPPSEEKQ